MQLTAKLPTKLDLDTLADAAINLDSSTKSICERRDRWQLHNGVVGVAHVRDMFRVRPPFQLAQRARLHRPVAERASNMLRF